MPKTSDITVKLRLADAVNREAKKVKDLTKELEDAMIAVQRFETAWKELLNMNGKNVCTAGFSHCGCEKPKTNPNLTSGMEQRLADTESDVRYWKEQSDAKSKVIADLKLEIAALKESAMVRSKSIDYWYEKHSALEASLRKIIYTLP